MCEEGLGAVMAIRLRFRPVKLDRPWSPPHQKPIVDNADAANVAANAAATIIL